MDTNELPVADSAVGLTGDFAKWLEVEFHNVPDSDAATRKEKIEAFYLGFLRAVQVLKGTPYKAQFKWSSHPGKKAHSLDYKLIISVSPPPTFLASRKATNKGIVALEDPIGQGDGDEGDDIDPPRPPAPPPPTM
jgi:hypothetical protein